MASFYNSNVPSLLSYREELQPTYLDAPAMDRRRGSRSSISSGYSNGSNPGQGYNSSPGSSYCPSYGSPSDGFTTPKLSSSYYITSPSYVSSTPSEANSQGNSQVDETLPPFDPAKEGDPRISWQMYYDFMVTKTEAYWKLKPGYVVSERYPDHIKSDPINVKFSDSRQANLYIGRIWVC